MRFLLCSDWLDREGLQIRFLDGHDASLAVGRFIHIADDAIEVIPDVVGHYGDVRVPRLQDYFTAVEHGEAVSVIQQQVAHGGDGVGLSVF